MMTQTKIKIKTKKTDHIMKERKKKTTTKRTTGNPGEEPATERIRSS